MARVKKKIAKTISKKITGNKRPPRIKIKEVKTRKFDPLKYVRILVTEPTSKFKKIGESVFRKELKWVRYEIEDSIGVHYYLILKKNKNELKA